MNDETWIVAGLLLHLGGLDKAPYEMKVRVVESINPVQKEWGIWQAQDNLYGGSWIIALNGDPVMQLVAQRWNGDNWMPYGSTVSGTINDLYDTGGKFITATVSAFHDTRHDVAPPAFLRIGDKYIYRNVSGWAVPIDSAIAQELLAANKIDSK